MIPKIIHYCWFGPGKMSTLERKCIQSWKKYLPDFEIKCWNEENFDVDQFAFTKEAYKEGKYAFVSDVARLYALYSDGGIYMDTDMLVIKEFEQLLAYSFFAGFHQPGKIGVGIVGCTKQNSVVQHLLEQYRFVSFSTSSLYLIPEHFDRLLLRENYEQEITILPVEAFYAYPFEKRNQPFKSYLTENSLAVHLWNHSWKTEFSTLHDFYFFTSLKLYFKNLISFKPEFLVAAYHRRYFKALYSYAKKYVYLKLINRS